MKILDEVIGVDGEAYKFSNDFKASVVGSSKGNIKCVILQGHFKASGSPNKNNQRKPGYTTSWMRKLYFKVLKPEAYKIY